MDIRNKAVLVRIDAQIEGNYEGVRMRGIEKIASWAMGVGVGRLKLIGHGGGGMVEERMNAWWGGDVEIDDDLRINSAEERNSEEFARELAAGFDVYINEAFSVSHREHTSVNALPKVMQQQGKIVRVGTRFAEEVDHLEIVRREKVKKIIFIGGAKAADKARWIEGLAQVFDAVLIGGRVVEEELFVGRNVFVAGLSYDRLDIDSPSIEKFVSCVDDAKIVVLAGPVGKFEEETARHGTESIFRAVSRSEAIKIAGGGNTEVALRMMGLTHKFDWISVGGGAMLQYLATGSLPGIEVISV